MKISIVTVTKNSEKSIKDCLDSVQSQKYLDVEHIVIDGVSTDCSMEILKSHVDQLAVLRSESDSGIYDALNKGISLATGEIIGFLHADDLYANDHVLTRLSTVFDNPQVQAVYGDLVYVDKNQTNKIIRNWQSGDFSIAVLNKGWMPPHPTLFLRRSLYEKFGVFDTQYRIAADYDFILRVLTQLAPEQVVYIPEVLVRMRTGGVSNRSFKQLILKSWEDYQIIRRHKIGGLGTLLRKNFSKLPQFFTK